MISVVGVIRKAQAQPVGAGNWFVHDGQAQGNAFGNASVNGIENKIPVGVRIGNCCTSVIAIRHAACIAVKGGILETLTAQDQVAAAGDFGVFFHLRRKTVHRCFQVGVLAGQVTGLYFQAVHAGLDLQHFAGQVLVALLIYGCSSVPCGVAGGFQRDLLTGYCPVHDIGAQHVSACIGDRYNVPRCGQRKIRRDGYFERCVGHALHRFKYRLRDRLQRLRSGGCQQQVALDNQGI